MTDDDDDNGHRRRKTPTIYVIRLGEGQEADYAVCKRIGIIKGSARLPGTGRMVAEVPNSQGLMSGKLSEEELKGLKKLLFMSQSAENDLDDD